jgi:phage terminase large subunit-like protein
VGCLFGWKNTETGYRRFNLAYLEVARKNGKTTMIAGIGNFLFLADKEPGAEVYTAATKKDQAKLSHSESVRMVKKSPKLKKLVKIYNNNMSNEATASKYEPLGADADTVDGLNVSGGLIDELHAHKKRDMWDVLETATGSRRQPLQMAITTAGTDQAGICYEQHQYVAQILKGAIEDDNYFGIIYTLDLNKDWPDIKKTDEDSWSDEGVWLKANPNLGLSAKIEDLRRKCKKAKIIPAAQNNFLRKHMDVWTQQVSRWIDLDTWDSNNEGGVYVYQ